MINSVSHLHVLIGGGFCNRVWGRRIENRFFSNRPVAFLPAVHFGGRSRDESCVRRFPQDRMNYVDRSLEVCRDVRIRIVKRQPDRSQRSEMKNYLWLRGIHCGHNRMEGSKISFDKMNLGNYISDSTQFSFRRVPDQTVDIVAVLNEPRS